MIKIFLEISCIGFIASLFFTGLVSAFIWPVTSKQIRRNRKILAVFFSILWITSIFIFGFLHDIFKSARSLTRADTIIVMARNLLIYANDNEGLLPPGPTDKSYGWPERIYKPEEKDKILWDTKRELLLYKGKTPFLLIWDTQPYIAFLKRNWKKQNGEYIWDTQPRFSFFNKGWRNAVILSEDGIPKLIRVPEEEFQVLLKEQQGK